MHALMCAANRHLAFAHNGLELYDKRKKKKKKSI